MAGSSAEISVWNERTFAKCSTCIGRSVGRPWCKFSKVDLFTLMNSFLVTILLQK